MSFERWYYSDIQHKTFPIIRGILLYGSIFVLVLWLIIGIMYLFGWDFSCCKTHKPQL